MGSEALLEVMHENLPMTIIYLLGDYLHIVWELYQLFIKSRLRSDLCSMVCDIFPQFSVFG